LVRPLLLGLALAAIAGATQAQTYPAKPLRLVVAFPAGGTADVVARTLAQPLGAALGQNVIVENRAGGGTVIATELVARAAADGHTLLLTGFSFSANSALRSNLPFDTQKDFAAVARIESSPWMLAAHPSLPVKNVKELIALARTRPGQLLVGNTSTRNPSSRSRSCRPPSRGISVTTDDSTPRSRSRGSMAASECSAPPPTPSASIACNTFISNLPFATAGPAGPGGRVLADQHVGGRVDRGAVGRVTRVFVSALNGDGLDALRRLIADEVARAADLNSQDTVTILPDGSAVESENSAPADPA
jgi:hypothetical protein